ncbi:MAG: RHS repeat protein, partial [bacterium]|nr:RHS repeat protein [bacterium]
METLSSSHGLTVTREYEPQRNLLTQVKNAFGPDLISQYEYTSDALGRRESMSTSGPAFEDVEPNPLAEITATYSSNELNQYTQISTEAGNETPAYDLDGNLTDDGTFQYDYDAENRLISVTPLNTASGLKKTEFAYDYTHRRISKQVYSDNIDTWTLDSGSSFVYDGWNLIKESTTTDAGTSTEYSVWGLDLSGSLQGAGGIGGLLLRNTDSGSFLYLYDANGNVDQL